VTHIVTRSYLSTVRRRRARRMAAVRRVLPWLLGAAAVGAQIAYPLVEGEPLRVLTIAAVVVFFAAAVSHAWFTRGGGWALGLVAITAGGGFAAEAIGLRTGAVFGDYVYHDTLGWQLAGVPVVIPLAWTMMAYPALVIARRLTRRWVPIVAAVALAAWDLFLDPQMVEAGHWSWQAGQPELPGVPGVPVTNYLGWLAVALVMMTVLHLALPRRPADDRLPVLLYLWTYFSQLLAHAMFFDRPAVAVYGGVGMGLIVVPYLYVLWRDRP
jgi:putative membrane protein